MSNFPVGGFRQYFFDFLARLLAWQTLIRFNIPLFVFLSIAASYTFIKNISNIADTTLRHPNWRLTVEQLLDSRC